MKHRYRDDGEEPRLTVFTGTKAQFIKLLPVLLELKRREIPHRIIDTRQHARSANEVLAQFQTPEPDAFLASNDDGVRSVTEGIVWMARIAARLLKPAHRLRAQLFGGHRGVCLVHGDTASALLSALLAKRAGQEVAHIEAGLRSYNFLHPFPEEIVRVLVMRLADHLFAPNPGAMRNLERMGLSANAVLLPANTSHEVLSLSLAADVSPVPDLPDIYGVATVHRLESIYRPRTLELLVDLVLRAHRLVPMLWVEHPPTGNRLEASGQRARLLQAGVRLLPLQPHPTFVRLLKNAHLIMTDGGSIQEEASYLGTPCLLLRRTTERDEGLDENVVLSRLDPKVLQTFLSNLESYRRPVRPPAVSPSQMIVRHLVGPTQAVARSW